MPDLPEIEPKRLSETSDSDLSRLIASARTGAATTRTGSRERIWKKLIHAPAPSHARWLIPAVAVGCAALVFFFRPQPSASPLLSAEPFATLALASGAVDAASAGAWSVAQVGAPLSEGSRLRTAANSRAYTRFSGGGALFGEGTLAALSREGAGLAVKLEVGAATFALRQDSTPLHVGAAAFAVDTHGSVFQVKVGSEQVVDVLVHEGTVRVRGPSTDLGLAAGQSWSSRTGPGHATMNETDAATARVLGALSEPKATLRIPTPVGAEITIDGVRLGLAPLGVLQPLGPHQVTAEHHGERISGQVVLVAQDTAFQPAEPPLPQLASPAEKPLSLRPGEVDPAAPLQQKLKGALSPGDRDTASYELARVLCRRGKNTEALGLYEKLAVGSGAWSEPALYEVGRLKLRSLSDPAGAVTAYADYRRRYPAGALAHEVALSSIEAQLARGSVTDALREMDAFLVTFASSERLEDVRFVRATVRRDRGDCEGALFDYLLLVKSARHGDDALYFSAYCAQQQGDANAARRGLSQYVLQFPGGRHLAEARAALGR